MAAQHHRAKRERVTKRCPPGKEAEWTQVMRWRRMMRAKKIKLLPDSETKAETRARQTINRNFGLLSKEEKEDTTPLGNLFE